MVDRPTGSRYLHLDNDYMRLARTTLSPVLRLFAALTLVAWMTAASFCLVECVGSHSETAGVQPAADVTGQSHDSDKRDHHDQSFCASLRSIALMSPERVLARTDFGLTFALNFVSTAPSIAFAQPEAAAPRQPPDCHRVFTPEVSLGPAFRSLAPPPAV